MSHTYGIDATRSRGLPLRASVAPSVGNRYTFAARCHSQAFSFC
jgi:hypothetical protein